MTIRQPIVTVCGHVDHGKTTLLDSIRGTSVQEKEAGGITQKISFTLLPADKLNQNCPLIAKSGIKLDIPGFLFIDTPGHAAFTNLRKRGGSLADLAIVVIDINEGIMPQTAEVIQILKANKTPFIIALNKIDNISGWRTDSSDSKPLKESIESQALHVKQDFDEKLYTLIGSLHPHGFEADIFYNITDFTKKVALVPCSARTKQGLQELMMVLCGLSQKFLKKQLELGKEPKGVILEVKKEKAMPIIEAILYDGELSARNQIAIATFEEVLITKIRGIQVVQPLSSQFKPAEKATAATGIRLHITEKAEEVLPGMPFMEFKNNEKEIRELFQKELAQAIHADSTGIVIKADSLGSLEALIFLLKQKGIKIIKSGIGNINKVDAISAKVNEKEHPLDAIIIGFNVEADEEAKSAGVKILTNDVIYKLIEDLEMWRTEKQNAIEKEKLMELATLCKLRILPQFVFRNSNPAIFGVRVEGGKATQRTRLVNENDEKIGQIKAIQHEKESKKEAIEGMEVAISLPGVAFDRQLKDKTTFLFSNLSETEFRLFKKNKSLLSPGEISVLQDIAKLKRKTNPTWGV